MHGLTPLKGGKQPGMSAGRSHAIRTYLVHPRTTGSHDYGRSWDIEPARLCATECIAAARETVP